MWQQRKDGFRMFLKKLVTVSLVLFTAHAAFAGGSKRPAPVPDPVPQEPTPAPIGSLDPDHEFEHVGVSFISLTGFSAEEKNKVYQAAAVLEQVLNSVAFKNRVLNFRWNGEKQFADNNELSNEEILIKLKEANELLLNEIDHIANFELTIYNPNFFGRNVVGYTYPDSLQIFMNRNFFSSFTAAEVAGNMAHEWTHKLGFDHDFNSTAKRPYSVPYAIGDIVNEIGDQLIK